MVEKSVDERSGVEAWGWDVRGWNVLQPFQAAVKTWKLMLSSLGSNNLPPLEMHFSDAALKESFTLSGTKHFPSTIWHFPEKFDLGEWIERLAEGRATELLLEYRISSNSFRGNYLFLKLEYGKYSREELFSYLPMKPLQKMFWPKWKAFWIWNPSKEGC